MHFFHYELYSCASLNFTGWLVFCLLQLQSASHSGCLQSQCRLHWTSQLCLTQWGAPAPLSRVLLPSGFHGSTLPRLSSCSFPFLFQVCLPPPGPPFKENECLKIKLIWQCIVYMFHLIYLVCCIFLTPFHLLNPFISF